MIPVEAVEAAARVIFDRHHARYDWGSIGNEFKDIWRQDAKAALEAAAPHMRAQALEDAADSRETERLFVFGWEARERLRTQAAAERSGND